MIKIKKIEVLRDKKVEFLFSDNTDKIIDFAPFIGNDKLSKALSSPAYFEKIQLYENGRGIYWPNGYDFCPDFLYRYQPNEKKLITENG